MSAIVEMEVRRAPASVGTWNEEARTVEVIWAAGADVRRYSWSEGGYYIERLRMTPEAVDLTRLNGGASLLDAHQAYSMSHRVGVVVAGSARIVAGQGIAKVQLLNNEGGEALAEACRSGAGFLVSVGYSTSEYERSEGDGTSLPIIEATRWLPMEISAVPIPADPAARTRSHEERNFPMSQTEPNQPADPVLAERERATSIRALAARVPGIDHQMVERALATGTSLEVFREAALNAIVERQELTETYPHSTSNPRTGRSIGANTIAGLTEVLGGKSTRSGVEVARKFLYESGRDIRSMSDREVARAVMGGGGSIWAGGQRAAHATGDFQHLVASAAANVLLDRFNANPSALKRFSRRRNAPDFRDVKFFRPGEAPALLKVNEHGEIKSGTLNEESNGFSIDTYARIFALTFQAGVNDGLGAFADWLSTFAESGIQLEGDLFAALLHGNGPRLDDGHPLFHETHGNLADVGAAPSIATIDAGVIAMRTQRNVNNGGFAGTAPSAILVGPRLELVAKQLVSTIQATDPTAVNPHRLEVVVEDRFGRDFAGWYLLADGARRPAFLHGGLESEGDAPKVETREGWEVLGTEFRCVHHFGAGVHDYRAIYFNPGA